MAKLFSKFWFSLLLVSVIFLRLPSVFEPFTYGDEGVYLTLGLAIKKGLILYKDAYDNKPPLIYLLATLAGNFQTYRLIYFCWGLITVFAFKKLVQAMFKDKPAVIFPTVVFAILTSIHTFEGNIANAENFFILFTILGFLCFFSEKNFWDWGLAGLLFSLATLFKIPAVFDFISFLVALPLLIHLRELKNYWRKILALLLGFALPWLVTFGYFLYHQILGQFILTIFAQNIPYLASWQLQAKGISLLLFSLTGRAFIAGAALLLIYFTRKKLPQKTSFLLIWFVLALFAGLLSGRPYPHYLIQGIVPASLFLGINVAGKITRLLKFVPLALTFLTMIIFNFYSYPNFSYYKNFYAYAVGKNSKSSFWSYFTPNAQNIYQTANYLQQHTQPGEKIFVWTDDPYIYALSQRLPLGKYTVAYHIIDLNKRQEIIDQLQYSPPSYIVTASNSLKPFPALLKVISNNYFFAKNFGPFQIHRKIVKEW